MSEGLNLVILVGNIGADPEFRISPDGRALLKFRLATTESYTDQRNTRQERTEWHSVVTFGRYAETMTKMLAKGLTVTVVGANRTSTYEKNGEKRYRTDVYAKSIFAGNLKGAFEAAARAAPAAAPAASGTRGGAPSRDDDEDEIPF